MQRLSSGLRINSASDDAAGLTIAASDTGTIGVPGSSVSTQAGAQAALDAIDGAIKSVSNSRGSLGAIQNRLQSTINNLIL